ncbi:MAG: Gfo/Idh/MocA family oxidoreductase [Rhodospirillales bacterium]|nr:Gfo/Idh/MocA family oxidoreductase [Rhodospirillales bacterium]
MSSRCIVVGLGVQGAKRLRVAGADCVGTVDPFVAAATWRSLNSVPLDAYDAALLCVPDAPKAELVEYLVAHGKHALVEKPFAVPGGAAFDRIEAQARRTRAVVYSAYNHRFEPGFAALRAVLAEGRLGRIYHCRVFYGNGTARLVRESGWRDAGAGVLPDLGSHLLDALRFWFGDVADDFRVVQASRFENKAPDRVQLAGGGGTGPTFDLDMTLLSWRNHFTCDVFAEHGSAHLSSLCKWGESSLTVRTRVLPAGRPEQAVTVWPEGDPTWAAEYAHFKALCAARPPADLSGDRWLHAVLSRLSAGVAA